MRLTQKSRIARLREDAGITQVQLAALIGVTPNTIQNWEKPNGLKQLSRYLKMAELFGCKVEDLVEYIPSDESDESTADSKAFSIDDIRELRERWGTATKASTVNQTGQEAQKV